MASRFWVGGAGTWDAVTTTHWAASSGTAGGQTVPGAADTVTFDGASGGGTVTVNTTVNVVSITMGAFTGTLDFSANNNNVTVQTFSGTGSGTRTLNLGNGTWTITSTTASAVIWSLGTTTGLTFNANSSSIILSGTSGLGRSFQGGSLSYNSLSLAGQTGGTGSIVITSAANTFASLAISAPHEIAFPAGGTTTITNAFTWTGTSSNPISISSGSFATSGTISTATGSPAMSWVGIRDLTFSGGATFTATNSFNLGNNTGITISAPSAGGGLAPAPIVVARGTPY